MKNKYTENEKLIRAYCDSAYDTYHQKYGMLVGFLQIHLTDHQRELMEERIAAADEVEMEKISRANDMNSELLKSNK